MSAQCDKCGGPVITFETLNRRRIDAALHPEKSEQTLTQTVTWIPVEERLPEPGNPKHTLLHVACHDHASPWQGWYSHRRKCWFDINNNAITVQFWAEPLKHPSEL